MKGRWSEKIAWALVIITALYAPNIIADVRRPGSMASTTSLADLSVTTAKIAADAVTSAKIAADTIVAADIATGGVATAEILDGTILTGDIATDTILAGNIATGAVGTAEILDATILAGDLADNAVTAAKLNADAVTTAKIADGTIAAGDIGTGAVTTTGILDATILAGDIALNTLTPARMADGDWGIFSMLSNVASMDRWAPSYVELCVPGESFLSSNTCATMTNQGAGPTSLGAAALKQVDTTLFHQFRLYVQMSNTGATNMDIDLQCDTTVDFSTTPTLMVEITQASLGAGAWASSAWTSFSANECLADDVFIRAAAVGGDGAEDPVIRQVYMALR